ncbi:MAG: prepilin-type N-terminal cleavage/methylation domain-containing protein, partial [Pirellula sp.]
MMPAISYALCASHGERRLRTRRRRAFTLLELILSLALAAVVAGLMGSLVQIFLVNQERGQDSVRQAQLARAVLNMIAEDIRTTVRYQPFDVSGLQQLLSSGSGGGGGGAPSGGDAP